MAKKILEESSVLSWVEPAPTSFRPCLRWLVVIVLTAGALSVLILSSAPAPFFWLGLTWAAVLFAAILFVKRSWPKALLLNLGVVACVLAAIEGYLVTHEYVPPVYPDGDIYVHDGILGWAPKSASSVHAIKPMPTGLLYPPQGTLFDVHYTIGPDGLRVAPPYRKDLISGTILFFGCSFTFGEGLKDDETLPYQVGLQSQGRYRTLNFGVGGYGPEQMLAAIERGRVSALVDTPPQYAYYVALAGHIWRVAGRVAWGGQAPRYVLTSNGDVHQDGNLSDRKPLDARLGIKHGAKQLRKSAIWRLLSFHDDSVSDEDLKLYLAVVRRSRDLLVAQYPGIQFRVILWTNPADPGDQPLYEKMQNGFREMGIPFDRVEDILPGYRSDQLKYVLSSADHHPNALADRLLAEQVLHEVAH
jgi:hypothetical protein